jgi:hypothetical protein
LTRHNPSQLYTVEDSVPKSASNLAMKNPPTPYSSYTCSTN